MSNWIFYNDEFVPAGKPVLQAGNRLLQYGDGLFETMRVHNGKIVLEEYHFQRLRSGMEALMLDGFDQDHLKNAVLQLCAKNEQAQARVRLTVFRDRGAIIESWPLQSGYVFKTDPFVIDMFTGAKKTADRISPFKTAAYLPYALAAIFCRKNGYDDCLLENSHGMICDSSIANVFYVRDGVIHTPPHSEGCIDGVMRRHIISNFPVKQVPVAMTDIINADEVFLTNVIRGIQPVSKFMHGNYQISLSREIFNKIVRPLTEH